MEPIFDISFITEKFQVTNIGHYLDLLKKASNNELKQFRKQVKRHQKENKQHIAFNNVPSLTTHQAIIKAIDYELLKRSWRNKIFSLVFPFRKWVVDLFTELELTKNDTFGVMYSSPKCPKGGMRITHKDIYKVLKVFWLNHWRFIVTTIIAVTFGVLHLIK